jgi:LCP family protein required for cell wall assembly
VAESRSGGQRPVADCGPGSRSDATRRNGRQAYRRAHRHPWLRRGSIAVAGGLALVLVLGVMGYLKLNSNITKLDLTKALGKRPSNSASADSITNLKPVNILVMGSDTRVDLGTTEFGTTPGGGSDTTLLVHLSGDRKSAVVVSIPRDSMVRAPRDCKDPNSSVADGTLRMFNANFNEGGPACVIRTLEGNTGKLTGGEGIFIDHFVVVDFTGFQSMVAALGEVEVCLPKAVNDKKSKLNLPKGRSRVSGEQALAFVRTRYGLGDGGDISRIDRQQAFMSAMVQEATSSKQLLRPDRLFRFLLAATDSLTIDEELGTNAMRELAQSVVGLKTSQVKFVTVPIEDYPPDKNRVQWLPAADALWKSIHDDAPLPGSKPAPATKPRGTATTAGPALTVTPDQITMRISNASGVNGLARQAAEDLRSQGFRVSGTSTDTDLLKQGVAVAYSNPNVEEARTVAAAFPGARLVVDETIGSEVQVTLGTGSAPVVQVPNRVGTTPLPARGAAGGSTPSPEVTIKTRSADSNICAP